jgi:hypothetical protein
MIQGAMKAYKMFSGDQGSGGGGNFLDNIGMIDYSFLNTMQNISFFSRLNSSKCSKNVCSLSTI